MEELKGVIRQTIVVRRVTLGAFLTLALAIRLFFDISFEITLLIAPLAWFGLTFPFKSLMERQQQAQTLHKIHAGFFLVELILITYLVHLLEGVEWIGVIFYLFTVIYANFFLPRLFAGLITAMAIALYGALVFLEYFGLLPHRTLFPEQAYKNISYVVISFLAGSVGVYAILAYTIRIFANLLRARERELERLSLKILTAQQEEHRKLAQKLHDEIGQTLTVAKMNLDMLKEEKPPLSESAKLLGEALLAIRELSHRLRPPLLEELGLVPALQSLCERFKKATGTAIEFKASGFSDEEPPSSIQMVLYRAAQEALSNIARHARAQRARLELSNDGRRVRLLIQDDGCGFRVEDLKESGGLGLLGIREQVGLFGGSFSLSSRPGEGTTLRLELPIGESTTDS